MWSTWRYAVRDTKLLSVGVCVLLCLPLEQRIQLSAVRFVLKQRPGEGNALLVVLLTDQLWLT